MGPSEVKVPSAPSHLPLRRHPSRPAEKAVRNLAAKAEPQLRPPQGPGAVADRTALTKRGKNEGERLRGRGRGQWQKRQILGVGGMVRGRGTGAACHGASGRAAWDTDEDQAAVPARTGPRRASGDSAKVSAKLHQVGAARLPGERSGLLERGRGRPNRRERS